MAKGKGQDMAVIVEIPVSDRDTGGFLDQLARHVDVALTPKREKARIGLRRLHRGLFNTAQTSSGKFVVSRSDAIVWLLEHIADA